MKDVTMATIKPEMIEAIRVFIGTALRLR